MQKLLFKIVSTALLTLLLTSAAHAQSGGCVSGQVIGPPQPLGLGQPVPSAPVRVCSSTATGSVCSPLTPGGVFLDPALTQPLSNPLTADQNGNYNFCAAQGGYLVQEFPGPGITYSFQVTVGISPTGSYTFSGNNIFTGTNQFSGVELSDTLCTGALAGFTVLCGNSGGLQVSVNGGSLAFIPIVAGDLGGTSASPTVTQTHITGGSTNVIGKFNATGNLVNSACTDNATTVACTEPISSTGGVSGSTITAGGGTPLTTTNSTGTGNLVKATAPTIISSTIQGTTSIISPTTTGTDTGTETMSGKTLTSPTITSPTTTGTDNGAETLGAKTLNSPAFTGTESGMSIITPIISTPTLIGGLCTGASASCKQLSTSTTCTTAASAGANCSFVVTWPGGGFSDTNYNSVCWIDGIASGVPILSGSTKTAGGQTLFIFAATAAASSTQAVDCIAMHN